MKYNYPIKYTVMPVFKEGSNCPRVATDGYGYVVTKCFLIGETTKYSPKGDFETKYEVVYPFRQKSRYNNLNDKRTYLPTFTRVNPNYHFMLDKCENSEIVSKVYDTHSEALKAVNEINNGLLMSTENPSETKKFLNACKELENKIEESLSYLTLDYHLKKKDLILYNGEKYKILDNSFIYSYGYEKFLGSMRTYTMNKEDYESMKYKIVNNIPVTEEDRANASLLLLGTNKDSGIRLFADNIVNTLRENRGCFMLYYNIIEYDSHMIRLPKYVADEKPVEYFTTETEEDIIRSYIDKYEADEYSIDAVTRIAGHKVLELKLPTE